MQQETINRTAEPHSVEISRNSKGEAVIAVKVYSEDEHDAAKRAAKVYKDLAKEFPFKG